jgi:hypothetical protein
MAASAPSSAHSPHAAAGRRDHHEEHPAGAEDDVVEVRGAEARAS